MKGHVPGTVCTYIISYIIYSSISYSWILHCITYRREEHRHIESLHQLYRSKYDEYRTGYHIVFGTISKFSLLKEFCFLVHIFSSHKIVYCYTERGSWNDLEKGLKCRAELVTGPKRPVHKSNANALLSRRITGFLIVWDPLCHL